MSSLRISNVVGRWILSRSSGQIRSRSNPAPSNPSVNKPVMKEYKPSSSERFYLYWSGKYKSMAEVPDRVTGESIDRAKSAMRIKISNWGMALTLVGCIAMAISGKRKAEKGESVTKMNLDWHKQVDEQHARDNAK